MGAKRFNSVLAYYYFYVDKDYVYCFRKDLVMNLKKIKLYNYVYFVLLDEIDNTDLYKFVNIIDKNKVLYPKICLKQESYEEDYDYDGYKDIYDSSRSRYN